VDAKHIVLATLHALAGEKSGEKTTGAEAISPKLLEKAIRDLGIDPEKRNPATS
jgi:pyruvate dehydrogenase complex dehydrogenase (E1) component